MPVSSAAGNYWGGDRPGSNLFSNSIVAVDASTGRYRWHFQTVHHDLWDLDLPNPPVLVDIERDGRTLPALASIGKTAYVFILDRATGEPVFGVEERPVPEGSVPDEWYSPTQPFPVKPAAPVARVTFDRERDMVRPEDTTPQHAAACEALWERSGGFVNLGPYTPFAFHEDGAPPRSTLQLPGALGGVNWGGVAADPTRGLLFMHANDSSLVGWIERKRPGANYGNGTEGSTIPFDRGSVDGPGPYFTFSAPVMNEAGERLGSLPCYRPPWSRLTRDRRELGRGGLGDDARHLRAAAARQAAHGQHGQRGSERHGRRPRVRRCDERPPIPRVRLDDGSAALGGHAGRQRECESDDVPRARRQTVRRRRSRR